MYLRLYYLPLGIFLKESFRKAGEKYFTRAGPTGQGEPLIESTAPPLLHTNLLSSTGNSSQGEFSQTRCEIFYGVQT